MKEPQKPSSPIQKLRSNSFRFLQNSSLITDLPSNERTVEVKLPHQPSPSTPQKAPTPTTDSGGQILLDFTIRFTDLSFGDLLGQGGYGKVFAGEWKFNKVAIKQYIAQDFSNQTRKEIRKEAMVMALVSTQSDYLVRLRGIVLEEPHYSLVMEYLPGGDLFNLLKSSETLTWPRRYQIALNMTIGLHHLHERGVLHRDLKSLNVLLDNSGRAKLADFGLSTLKTSSVNTMTEGFKGTILWSAPELFKWGAKSSVASDIYSLGMVLWELASRKIPFANAPSAMIAMDWVKLGKQEIVPKETPEEFKQLIKACWDKEPSKRPTADTIAKHLDSLLEKKTEEDVRLKKESKRLGEESKEIHQTLKDKSAPIKLKASHQGPYKLAKQCHEKKDYVQARIYYEEALQQGNKSARNKLATLLMRGQGGPADEKRAVKILQEAVADGDEAAMHNLSEAYKYGVGVDKDLTKAAILMEQYKQAAKKKSIKLPESLPDLGRPEFQSIVGVNLSSSGVNLLKSPKSVQQKKELATFSSLTSVKSFSNSSVT
ncbi:MAG: protein kinase [Proteobacteria bacterium]|nr:protein kinase [Pseudomonadota bacterium]